MSVQMEFENPNKKPLGELTFHIKNNGVAVTVSALSKHWVEVRPHAKYLAIPITRESLTDTNTINEWLNEADWFNKEIEWMLGLEHHRFWSYMLFDPACMSSIVSFLQEATPCYIPIQSLTDDHRITSLYSSILKNVLAVICRMITNKESETEWITKDHLAELLYKKFLISIPILIDILIAYGRSNGVVIKRIIETITKIELKYVNDLRESIQSLGTAFKAIASKTDANESGTSVEDLALFALDCAYTIRMLLEVYPASQECYHHLNVLPTITNFYDSTIPKMHKNIYLFNVDSIGLKYLSCCRLELLGCFRAMVSSCMDAIMKSPSDRLPATEKFIAILQEAMCDHEFVVDYQMLYPIQNDIEILQQACPELNMFKIDFVVQAFTADATRVSQDVPDPSPIVDEVVESTQSIAVSQSSGAAVSNTDHTSIEAVLDILPHLERSFVVKLLSRYESTDLAIGAVLEGNLPPDLDVDSTLEEASPASNIAAPAPSPPPASTLSSEENAQLKEVTKLLDEIGINQGTTVIIKADKRKLVRVKNERKVLDDKDTIREWKSRYEQYGYVSEDYEDEYDDSYDALAESETKSVNHQLKQSGALNVTLDDVDDSDSESGEEAQNRDVRRDFCENPEAVRERYARLRNNRYANTRKGPPPATSDVVGNAKGQGQAQTTLVNRHKKDVNKSSRGNHNRRQGAAFKRNRGMIPS